MAPAQEALQQAQRAAAEAAPVVRKEFGFTRDPKRKFGVECVFSPEQLRRPAGAIDVRLLEADVLARRPQIVHVIEIDAGDDRAGRAVAGGSHRPVRNPSRP